jgi:hypothetical protein
MNEKDAPLVSPCDATPSGETPLAAASERRLPDAIPNYDLISRIGRGGFGDVYIARERVTDAIRAVKIVPKGASSRAARDIEGVTRYQHCAHQHPNLVQILTVGETDGSFHYVMEVADNRLPPASSGAGPAKAGKAGDVYDPRTLRSEIRRRGRFDAAEALELVSKLASAAARLHEEGLAHNDLKPENVLFVKGEPKIADLSLMSPNDASTRSGTPAYMTPEGTADDAYALGKILYELLSGRPAEDYPRLPPDLLSRPSRELSAAIRIANRACHPDSTRRFDSAAIILAELQAATRPGPWLLSRRAFAMAAAMAIVLLGILVAGAMLLRPFSIAGPQMSSGSPAAPRLVYQEDLSIDPAGLELARKIPPEAGFQPPVYANVLLNGQALPGTDVYAYGLSRPVDNFVVDYHIRSMRPWIGGNLGVARNPDDAEAIRVGFMGQPDGEGLQILLIPGASPESAPILGHLQPGLEYIIRLAHCRDGLQLALWPLGQQSRKPIVRKAGFVREPFAVRYLLFDGGTRDRRAEMEILGIQVASYDRPLDRAEDAQPKEVDGRVVPAVVPPVKSVHSAFNVNLLAGDLNPYESDAWMPIGYWAWWNSDTPGDAPKAIKCVPYSTAKRLSVRGSLDESGMPLSDAAFEGMQYLRFDGAEYGDFRATARIVFADPNSRQAKEDDPFLCRSHDASVGLGLRMQAAVKPGHVWGGGYVARLGIPADGDTAAGATLSVFDGLRLGPNLHYAVEVIPRDTPAAVVAAGVFPRDELFARDGFVLTVEAVGPDLRLLLDDHPDPVVELHDPDPAYFREGRLALFASRLMATFTELTVVPVESSPRNN